MGVLKLADESSVATPAAGINAIYGDTTVLPVVRLVDDAGNDTQISPIITASAAGQSPTAAVRTLITGSTVTVPAIKLKVGAVYRCRFAMTKTAAGVATSTIDVAVGTTGSTADAARLSFTKPAGTAAADEAWVELFVVVKAIGATGVVTGTVHIDHQLATTGHMAQQTAVITATSATFDTTTAGLKISVCLTSGASDAITITHCCAELLNN